METDQLPSLLDLMVEDKLLECCICKGYLDQPVQLQCLHSSCRQCAKRSCSGADNSTVECPACRCTTDLNSAIDNCFLYRSVRCLGILNHSVGCDYCQHDSGLIADFWCIKCSKYLCQDCSDVHPRHEVQAIEDLCLANQIYDVSAPQCLNHDKAYDTFCASCNELKCSTCLVLCLEHRHNISATSSLPDDLVLRIGAQAQELKAGLESSKALLYKYERLIEDLDEAHTMNLEKLRQNKARIVDALENAYRKSEKALEDIYGQFIDEARKMTDAVKNLTSRIDYALKYWQRLIEFRDLLGLLQQQETLLESMRKLQADLLQLPSLVDVHQIVTLDYTTPLRLSEAVSSWIGIPRRHREELCCETERESQHEVRGHSGTDSEEQGMEGKVLHVGEVTNALYINAVTVWDVAVSPDNHLLIAAHKDGLLEYELPGTEVSSWRPSDTGNNGADDLVWTVDSHAGGRVAVGLRYAKCVALLTRSTYSSKSWLEEKRILCGDGAPNSLSIHGDLLAFSVVHDQFVVVSLADGKEERSPKLGYGIYSLTVTPHLVVVVTPRKEKFYKRTRLWHWRGEAKEQHLVDCYSHKGSLMWRLGWDEQVRDICTTSSGQWLCLTLIESDRVVAVRAVDGKHLQTVLSNVTHGQRKPSRLSLSRSAEERRLAVLSGDGHSITVYPASELLNLDPESVTQSVGSSNFLGVLSRLFKSDPSN